MTESMNSFWLKIFPIFIGLCIQGMTKDIRLEFVQLPNIYSDGFPDHFRIEDLLRASTSKLSLKAGCRICYDDIKKTYNLAIKCTFDDFLKYFNSTDCFDYKFKHEYKVIASVAYAFVRCQKTEKTGPNVLCPDPCITKCGHSECRRLNHGIFKTDYECKCKPGEVWSPWSMSCETSFNGEDLCNDKCGGLTNSFGCKIENGAVKCRCRDHMMGENCELPFNACVNNYKPGKPSVCGKENTCIAYNHTNKYNCVCDKLSPGKKKIHAAECQQDLTCVNMVCARGFCETKQSGNIATSKCICDAGWTGSQCESIL
jgi:hypothetical protein